MWKRLLYLPLILTCVWAHASPLKAHAVYEFPKGADTYHSSISLPDGFVQNSDNVLFDANAPVVKRNGFTVSFTTKSYAGQTTWTYTDPTNTSWIILRDSDSIIANNLSGSASVLIATVSANNVIGEVNAIGSAYFVDQTQGVYFWNGSSTTFIASSPKGSLITQFHGRVWVAGLAVPNGNLLYGSKQYDPTAWGTGVNPNDPVVLTVGLQDNFDNITALYPFLDTLYTFKHYLTYAVYGFDQTSFQISFLTAECGCIDQNSIQTFNHYLTFVSERGVEQFDGYTCTRISDPVKNKVDNSIASQGGANTQSWVQSSQADWSAGTFVPSANLTATQVAPALALTTGTFFDGSAADFSGGSFFNTQIVGNAVFIATNNVNLTNGAFSDASCVGGSLCNWSGGQLPVTSAPGLNCTITPRSSPYMLGVGNQGAAPTLTASVEDCNTSSVLSSQSVGWASNRCSWTAHVISQSGLARHLVKLELNGSNGGEDTVSDCFIDSGVDITFYTASDANTSSVNYFDVDDVTDGKSTIAFGAYTSPSHDTTVSSGAGKFVALRTNPSPGSVDFIPQSSPDNVIWTNSASTISNFDFINNRYVRYISTFTLSSGSGLISLNSVAYQWTSSSGAFRSQIHNLGSNTSWGNLSISDALNDGSIVFSICSSTNSNMSIPLSCANQTPNAQITIATGTYTEVFATFTVTAATQAPTLNSFTAQWFSGSRAVPLASTVWDNRYWLSLTTNTFDSVNDAVLVLSTKGSWSPLDIHAGGFTQDKNQLYHSDSNATGNVYLDNQGYNDNGIPINAFIQTKTYCEGDPTTEDYYESLYLTEDSLGNYNTTISYRMDRNPTIYSLSPVNQSEFSVDSSIKVPFVLNSSNQNFGKCIDFTFTNSDPGSPWNFYGWTDYAHPREVQ